MDELNESIFHSQYTISFLNDQIVTLKEDNEKNEIRLEEKTDLSKSYSNILEQLGALRE